MISDFLAAAAEQFQFVPERPADDAEFKRAYAKAAVAAGLTREQAVRVYAFETGGNGTYDVQAGLTSPQRKDARAISPAMGYNQLLSTNTVSLLAEHGDRFLNTLRKSAEGLSGPARATTDRKLASLQKMIIFSRSVPRAWSEQDKLAKTTAAASASTPRCSTATSARCCRRRSCWIPCCSRARMATRSH